MRSRARLVGLLAAGAVVVAAAIAGPPHAVPGALIGTPAVPPVTSVPRPERPPTARAPDLPWLAPVLQVAAALILLAGLVLVVVIAIRIIRARSAAPPAESAPPLPPPVVVDAPAAVERRAEVVRRGIAFSLDQMQREREPSDAIVRAWLGLQQTADDAGLPRGRAETPTEFTVRVLARTTADRDATSALLRLYLGARFGGAAATAADVAAARDALQRLEGSWSVPAAGAARAAR